MFCGSAPLAARIDRISWMESAAACSLVLPIGRSTKMPPVA